VSEPEEVTKARALVRQFESDQYAERQAAEERKRMAWVEAHVGRRFFVEEDCLSRYGDDRIAFSFTARLMSATANESEMVWDNGVVTSGVYILDPLDEPPSPITGEQDV
jgi:hypothetical protein